MRNLFLGALCLSLLGCGSGRGDAVRIDLPLPARLDLTLYDHLYFPGFIVDSKESEFDLSRESINFFRREFKRKEVMDLIEREPADFSDRDPRVFFTRQQPYFKTFNFSESEQTLAVTGVITYESVDRSGFRQVANQDVLGRNYYSTEFVEASGFTLTMRVYVYELSEGKLLYRTLLRDNMDVLGDNIDERLVYYDLLQRVSDRVLSLFSSTTVQAERNLL
jgi:hypothetical protein